MWLSVYACLFAGTLLNHLSASQSFFGEDRSFFEDLFDNRRHTKRLIKTSLFRPSLFHVIKFPNDECFDLSNQSGTCYTPLQCKAYGGTGTASCANGYGQCCIISRSCHNTTSQKVVYFKNPAYPQMNHDQNFCDLTIEIKDSDICQLKVDFLDFQMDQPTDGDCKGDKLKITATGLTPSSIPTLCGTNRNQHMYIHMPPDNKDRSVSLLFETNNNGPYRWHIRITQIDCVRNSYSSAFSTFGKKIQNYRMKKKRSVDPVANNVSLTEGQNESAADEHGDHLSGRKKRAIFVTEASLRMTIPAPPGCLQYHTSANGIIESFNFGHYFNNLDYAICIERHPNICKVIFSCQDTGFGIETNNVGMQLSEGAAGDEQCSMDYFSIPGGSTNGDFPTKDRYCGAKLTAIDYNGNNNNRQSLLGQQVITKTNGPIVLRFHTDGFLLGKIRQGFRIKFEQSAENCQQANSAATALVGYSASSGSSALPFSSDRLNGISPPSMALKKESLENLSRFNAKKISV